MELAGVLGLTSGAVPWDPGPLDQEHPGWRSCAGDPQAAAGYCHQERAGRLLLCKKRDSERKHGLLSPVLVPRVDPGSAGVAQPWTVGPLLSLLNTVLL